MLGIRIFFCNACWFNPRQAGAGALGQDVDKMLDTYLSSFFVAGQRKDHIHHGCDLQGVASLRVQLEGNRIVTMVLASDLLDHLSKEDDEVGLNIKLLKLIN